MAESVHPSLEGARAKINRAVEHHETLHRRTGNFVDTDPYDFPVEFDVESGWHVAYARVVEDPTPVLSVIVGEIAYECLSALNHVAWELAARKVGSRKVYGIKGEIQFPIAKNPGDFQSYRIVNKARVGKAALAVFKNLQPYSGPYGLQRADRHPLILMKEIADADKHRTLNAAYGEIGIADLHFAWDSSRAAGPTAENRMKPGGTLEDGAEISAIRFETGNAEADVYVDGEPSVEILFNTDNWSIRQRSLGDIIATTEACFSRLQTLFPT